MRSYSLQGRVLLTTPNDCLQTLDGALSVRSRNGRFQVGHTGRWISVAPGITGRETADGALVLQMAASETTKALRFSFDVLPGERFLGFGEQFSHLDLTGHAFPICAGEQGIGRGAQPLSALVNLSAPLAAGDAYSTYAPMPLCITTKGRCFVFETPTVYEFDVGKTAPNRVSVVVWGHRLRLRIYTDDNPLRLIEKHTQFTGRLSPLPAWAYGTLLGVRGGRDKAEAILSRCQEFGTPVTALWIEDWVGRRGENGGPPLWWHWTPDETLYPDFKNWSRTLAARGVRLLGYVNPFIARDDSVPLYDEGLKKGYFARDGNGDVFVGNAWGNPQYGYAMVDLTNPDAYAWLKEIIKRNMLAGGLHGWMADYAEYVPFDGRFPATAAHAKTPMLWAKLNREAVHEAGMDGQVLIFHRSASLLSNRHACAYWAGDQTPTFDRYDGLASAVTGMLTGGLCGMSINHTDIGGFTSLITPMFKVVRTPEIFMRWCEMSVFTPLFRTHDGAFDDKRNYQFYHDDRGYRFFARMGRLHEALIWYFRQLESEAAQRGHPLVRALYLHAPNDPETLRIKHQFLLGPDLLVSPVCLARSLTVRAYLPPGRWVCPWTERVYEGRRYERLTAVPGFPPVLVREGGQYADRLLASLQRWDTAEENNVFWS